MRLFDEMPCLENDRIILKEMTLEDAPALESISSDPKVYVYLPTFLYEQKYDDPREVIRRMREECFLKKDSIMLGIFLKDEPSEMAGIAEIYAYDEAKNKASVGVRLARKYWYQGIAMEAVRLMKEYLEDTIRIRTITAHIMRHNAPSAGVVKKLGFENRFAGLWEDWGREGPVLVDKYVCRNAAHPKHVL